MEFHGQTQTGQILERKKCPMHEELARRRRSPRNESIRTAHQLLPLFTLAACLLIGRSGAFAPNLLTAIRSATRGVSGSGSSAPRHRALAGAVWRVAGRSHMCSPGGVGGGGPQTGREASGIKSVEGEESWVGAMIRNKLALREAVEAENFSRAVELRDRCPPSGRSNLAPLWRQH